jgi:hypothetical protein
LEAELDRRFTRVVVLPQDQLDQDELTSAEKIRREWQAKNEAKPEKLGDATQLSDMPPSESLDIPDSTGNTQEQKALSTDSSFSPKSPASLSPIPETFSIPQLSEEDVAVPENEKVRRPDYVQSLSPPH